MVATFKKIEYSLDTHKVGDAKHSDVEATAPSNGQLLIFNSSTQKWEAADPNCTIVGSNRTLHFAVIDCASSGDNVIVAAVGSKKIKVCAYLLVVTAAVNCKWYSSSGTGASAISGDMNFGAKADGVSPGLPPPFHILETKAGESLTLNLSGAVAVDGHLVYFDDDAT
jgi:hypothetical protein